MIFTEKNINSLSNTIRKGISEEFKTATYVEKFNHTSYIFTYEYTIHFKDNKNLDISIEDLNTLVASSCPEYLRLKVFGHKFIVKENHIIIKFFVSIYPIDRNK